MKHTILAALLGALIYTASAADKPNILFIVADDMGFSDAGCYGSEIHTPNLDSLATGGLRFTQFYNTARCWSSRACILTGYYAQAVRRDSLTGFKSEKGVPGGGAAGTRPRWAQLLPDHLKPLGYRSYHSGKWHVDGKPIDNGFDHSYESANHQGFFSAAGHSEDGLPLPAGKVDGSYYSTVAIADHAIKYLKEHAEKYSKQPFFEYLAFHSPHFPIQAPPEDIAIYKDTYQSGWDAIRAERLERMKKLGIVNCELSPLDPLTVPSWNLPESALKQRIGPNEVGHAVPWDSLTAGQKEFQAAKMSVHAAMIHRMDIEIGRVLAQIKTMGALENTIVCFMSDNGASAEQIIRGLGEDPKAPIGSAYSFLGIGPGWASAANTPFRLYKSWEHEGGNCTPLIVHWPAGIAARGELRTNPGHLIDLVPTILELAGGKQPDTVMGLPVPQMHGRSLVPAFAKDNTVKHDYLWWNHDGNRAVRVGDWKLVADHTKSWELYDLSKDRSETNNLATKYPDKVKQLEEEWDKHAAEFHALSQQDPPSGPPGKQRRKKTEKEDSE
jgi:arylsulfatase